MGVGRLPENVFRVPVGAYGRKLPFSAGSGEGLVRHAPGGPAGCLTEVPR
jgi:hypothetical protein